MCGLQSDMVEIKRMLKKLNKKLDKLLEEGEVSAAMALSEHSLVVVEVYLHTTPPVPSGERSPDLLCTRLFLKPWSSD